jgi:hypothetical protein
MTTLAWERGISHQAEADFRFPPWQRNFIFKTQNVLDIPESVT